MTEIQIRREIKDRVKAKTLTEVARDLNISVQYLHDVMNHRRKPGKKLLRGLGLKKITEYVQA